jgi:hypothetical protein
MHHNGATLGPNRGSNKPRSRVIMEERVIDSGRPIEGLEADNSTLGKTLSRERRELTFVCTNINNTIEPPAFEGWTMFDRRKNSSGQRLSVIRIGQARQQFFCAQR